MSAYMVFAFDVVDGQAFAPYAPATDALIAKHGGELLVVDKAAVAIEGEVRHANVVLRFPSEVQARAFYDDPDYAPLKALRARTTSNATAYLAKGIR